jgi:iron complex transport system substrate-binding protein
MLLSALLFGSCAGDTKKKEAEALVNGQTRIVSLSGTTTEILSALGLQDRIVAVDVTSYYPAAVAGLPKVGHNRNISAEAILAQKPTLVIGLKDQTKPELAEQIRSAGVKVLLFELEHTIQGSKNLVQQMADTLGKTEGSPAIISGIDKDVSSLSRPVNSPKVLFIYARGTGTMMVAGDKTASSSIIEIAGGTNAVTGFEDFKPLTPEALVAANPDVILMFDKGLESLGGIEGLLRVPGVIETSAGKNKNVIEMDGQLLTGFGPRVGQAATELANKLNAIAKN